MDNKQKYHSKVLNQYGIAISFYTIELLIKNYLKVAMRWRTEKEVMDGKGVYMYNIHHCSVLLYLCVDVLRVTNFSSLKKKWFCSLYEGCP